MATQPFTLHIMLMGFFVFVPQGNNSLTILVPDLKDVTYASDGKPIPSHRALLSYSCANLTGQACTADDRRGLALKDFASLYPLNPTANNLGVRQLNQLQLSVNGTFKVLTPAVPTLPMEIPSLKDIDSSFSDKVDPNLIMSNIPTASRDMLAGRANFTNLTLYTKNVQLNTGFDTVFDFTPLRLGTPLGQHRQVLSDQVDLYMQVVGGCSVELQLDDFNGKNIAKITLNAPTCQNPSEAVDVMIYNQSLCTPSGSPDKCEEALIGNHYGVHHFEDFYDYSLQPPPIRHRKIPLPYNCGTTPCPQLDGVSRPICPTVQMKP
jgi:hypothetical protein